MKLTQILFKPKWQDKDADVRRMAVATDVDADLMAALPELTRTDADAGVRLAALKRVNDYERWRERSTGDTDGGVRRTARETYLTLLCASTTQPVLTRRIAELDTLDTGEMERVAKSAVDRDLRAEALSRITRPALLAECVLGDPDVPLRLVLLERITDPNLLERIIERSRKTDKTVNRSARERLDALRIAAGDPIAITERARILCDRIEALMRAPGADAASELVGIDRDWSALGVAVPSVLAARYAGAHALVQRAQETLNNPTAKIASINEAPPTPEPEVVSTQEIEAAAQALVSRARFDAALATAQAQARSERERLRDLQQATAHQVEQALPELDTALDAGDSATAHRLHAQIHASMKALDKIPAPLQQQLAPLEARYAELKHWQHWSNLQRRRALCTDIEALASAGLHPDAVATRVHDAREEWRQMDTAEGIDAAAEPAGIAKRFQALCQRALRPAQGYFAKRKLVRKSHGDEIQALLERITAIADDTQDWNGLNTARSEASVALRSLDAVDPRARTTLAKQLKIAIARLSDLLQAHEREVEAAKQRLIERAAALSAQADQTSAARESRELQKHWTATGNGRRAVDQRQWKQFRAACDAVFGKLDAQRKQREVDVAATHTQAQQTAADFEALASDNAMSTDDVKAKLHELDSRWQALETNDRALAQRQRQARDAIAMRLKDAARDQRLSRFGIAMRKYALLRGAENGEPVVADWEQLPASIPEFDLPLDARLARTQNPTGTGVTDEAAARDLLVRLEFLAGRQTPVEDRALRMNYQVQRLSLRMREGTGASPEHELTELLAAWFAQTPQSDILEARFIDSAKAAIEALP